MTYTGKLEAAQISALPLKGEEQKIVVNKAAATPQHPQEEDELTDYLKLVKVVKELRERMVKWDLN